MHTCQGHTKRGTKCQKKVKCGDFCHNHNINNIDNNTNNMSINKDVNKNVNDVNKNVNDVNKNINDVNIIGNCPVCLDDVIKDDDCNLICKHTIHIECAKQLHDNICPICRLEISYNDKISAKDINNINKQKNKDKEQQFRQEQHDIRRMLRNEIANNRNPRVFVIRHNRHNDDIHPIFFEHLENDDVDHNIIYEIMEDISINLAMERSLIDDYEYF